MHTMNQEPNWEWYRTFLSVYLTGSLSGAGRALGLTQPTVGRHIDSLEAALGQKLFTRSFDGYAPTETARALQPYAASIASTSAALLRVASSQGIGVRGTVRITASDVIGVEVLPALLADLRAAHPDLVIELVLSNAIDDLLRRDADIAVRMVQPTQNALIARQVGTIAIGLYAHRRYLDAHGVPDTIAALAGHALIGYDHQTAAVKQWLERFPAFARGNLALRCDSDLAHLGAIRAGVGIGWCQAGLAARDTGLVRILPNDCNLPLPTWIAMHEDLRASPRCAVTFAALVAGMTAFIG
jgi:DNA-binding transcriptional LysR family regulator